MTVHINVMEIKLPGEDDFSKRFNDVHDLFVIANDPGLTKEESDKAWEHYMSAKYCLEMGIG